MSDFKQGDSLPELRVTPDAGLTKRYAEASGDPNPIHTDPEFAKSVGLPGVHPPRPVLDGPGRARPHRGRRRRPPRAEAALGPVPRHGLPGAGDRRHGDGQGGHDGRIVTDTVAAQGDNRIIRNAEAELRRWMLAGRRRTRRRVAGCWPSTSDARHRARERPHARS